MGCGRAAHHDHGGVVVEVPADVTEQVGAEAAQEGVEVVPGVVGGAVAARIAHQVFEASTSARTTRNVMRWFLTTPDLADELRANTMRPYLYRWSQGMCERVEGRALADAPRFLRVGAVLGGVCTAGLWATLAGLVLTGRMPAATAGAAVVAAQGAGRALGDLVRYGAALFHDGLCLDGYHRFVADAGACGAARSWPWSGATARASRRWSGSSRAWSRRRAARCAGTATSPGRTPSRPGARWAWSRRTSAGGR